jgi:hypothetical protein
MGSFCCGLTAVIELLEWKMEWAMGAVTVGGRSFFGDIFPAECNQEETVIFFPLDWFK